jgi:hypothetical protein
MGSRKEHHFLPKFYQKNFSVDQDGKHIRLYNINSDFYFDHAAISGQAKMKYLYGEDDQLETQLEKLENLCAPIFRSIIEEDQLPESTAEGQLLGKFILYQHARTVRQGQIMNDMSNSLMRDIIGNKAENDDMSVCEMMHMVDKKLPYLAHLDYKLIINESDIPFITSDNPVVLYNQMMEAKNHGTPAAWANMGLQVFFPISPDHLIYLHDCYNYIANGRAGSSTITTNTDWDVVQLNTLQYLNCGEMLYFDDQFEKSDIETLIRNNQEARKKAWTPTPRSFGPYHWVEMSHPRIHLQLSLTRLSPRGRQFKPGTHLVYLRHRDFYLLRNGYEPG